MECSLANLYNSTSTNIVLPLIVPTIPLAIDYKEVKAALKERNIEIHGYFQWKVKGSVRVSVGSVIGVLLAVVSIY